MRLYTFVMAAMSGFAVSAAIQYGVMWWHERRQRLPPLFAAFAISVGVQSAVLAVFASAETIESLDRSLNWRTTIALLTHLFLLWLIAALGRREASWFVRATSVVLFVGSVANGAGINIVGPVVAMDQMVLPWGETVSLAIRGPGHPALAAVLYLAVLSVHVYSCVVARGLLQREPSTGWLMLFGGIGGTVSVLWSSLIDLNLVRAPYPTVVALVFWLVLFAVMLSRQFVQRGRQVRQANARFRGIMNEALQFIGLLATDGTLLEANRSSLRHAGVSYDEVIGRKFWDTPWWQHSPDLQQRLKDAVARATRGETIHFEATHPRPDGSLAYVDFSLKPLRSDDGAIVYLIPEGRDITERREAEERLISANERLHSFIEKSPSVAIQWYDRQGRVVLWNTASEELFGYSEAEAMGRTLDELFQGRAEFVEFVASLAQIAESGESIGPMHYPFTHRNGDARVCLATIFRIPGEKGEPLFACVDVDVTERTRLENKMRDSQRMQAIGQLAGGVAHDFNNLLTVIAGYCELLQVQLADDDERRRSVGAIHDATTRAAWLTQRLLAFSRQAIVEPKVIDVNVMIDEIQGILRRLIGESVQITIEHGDRPLPVSIDPGQWSQVMINLAINARDAMPDGGTLAIGARSDHRQLANGAHAPCVVLTVRDSGHGMPPETVAQIFEPFFTTKPIGQGTGLGLSVVQGIVVQAGGEISVDSEVGRGTTFTIALPMAASRPMSESSAPFDLTASGGETILLVEDEENLREMVTLALEPDGYRVLSAANGADALALVDAGESIDLLLSDMVMPGHLSGLQLREMLRARMPGLRVLMMSGYSSELPPGDDGAPAVPFLQKPFGLHALSVRIRELLDGEPDRDAPGPALNRT